MPERIDSPYAWARLGASVAASIITSVGMWAGILVLPQIQAEFGAGRGEASLPYTATMFGFAIGNLLLGRMVDRFGIAPVLAISGMAVAGSFAAGAYAPSMLVFSLLQALAGFASAAGFAPLIADVSHWFRKRRGIAVAAAACGNYAAGALWPMVVRDTLATSGWRDAFLLIAVIVGTTILPLSWMLRPRSPIGRGVVSGGASGVAVARTDLSPRALQILLAIAGVGCCVAMAMPQVHLVAYCMDLGYGVAAGAQMLSMMLGAGVLSRLFFGFVADYIGGVRTLLIGSVAQALALFLYLPFDGLVSLYIVSAIFGFAQGGIIPCYAIIVREYLPAEEAGKRVGVVITATVLGMALGGWMSGAIYDLTNSYQAAFLNGIGWNVLNIAIMLLVLSRTRREAAAGAVPVSA